MQNDFKKGGLVKETGLSDREVQELKEAFVQKYAMLKGWDYSNLSQEQISEVHQQDEYKKAGLLFS